MLCYDISHINLLSCLVGRLLVTTVNIVVYGLSSLFFCFLLLLLLFSRFLFFLWLFIYLFISFILLFYSFIYLFIYLFLFLRQYRTSSHYVPYITVSPVSSVGRASAF